MNPYANLQFTNPGNAFMQAFQGGQQQRREGETQNALSKYAQDPNNPEAMQGLAKWNPQMALQLQQQKRQEAMRGLEAHRENIIMGAKIIRQIQPKDQAGWQQVLGMAQQVGIDLSEVPQQFDPQYAQGLVSVAEALDPQKPQGTAMQQDYQFLQQENPQLAEQFLRNKAEGAPLIASNGDGTFTIIPRGMAQGQQQGQQAPPLPPGFVLDQGGPTPQASGGFPGN